MEKSKMKNLLKNKYILSRSAIILGGMFTIAGLVQVGIFRHKIDRQIEEFKSKYEQIIDENATDSYLVNKIKDLDSAEYSNYIQKSVGMYTGGGIFAVGLFTFLASPTIIDNTKRNSLSKNNNENAEMQERQVNK